MLKQCTIQIVTDRPLHPGVKPYHLRGAIGNFEFGNPLFHHHKANGGTVYQYPLIQYKIIAGEAWILGLSEGADSLASLDLLDKDLTLAKRSYHITKQETSYSMVEFGWCNSPLVYVFCTPWIALNQKNYESYHRMPHPLKRRRLLERILVGNLLSFSKGVGHSVQNLIDVEFLELRDVKTRLKGNIMLGFKGVFCASFRIPELWGIGKSTARGFGTVKIQNIEE